MNPIRRLRNDRGWMQRDCAKRCGITQQYWSYWETKHEILDLNYKTLRRIAKAFGLTYVDLLMKRRDMENTNDNEAH
jgi:transcriptional regulator with XRE-family HTH domain